MEKSTELCTFWVKPGSIQHFWSTLVVTLRLQGATLQVSHSKENLMENKNSLKKNVCKECWQAASEALPFAILLLSQLC